MNNFLKGAGDHIRKQALLADMQRRLRLLPAEDLQFLDELILKLQLNYTESLYLPNDDGVAAQRTPAMAFHYYAMAAVEAADQTQKINAVIQSSSVANNYSYEQIKAVANATGASTGTVIDALNTGPCDLTVANVKAALATHRANFVIKKNQHSEAQPFEWAHQVQGKFVPFVDTAAERDLKKNADAAEREFTARETQRAVNGAIAVAMKVSMQPRCNVCAGVGWYFTNLVDGSSAQCSTCNVQRHGA